MTSARILLRREGPWLALCLAFGVVLSLSRGQTNWWDILNYHIYNPWSLFHHREAKDLFAAGIQGYFDPIADIPYYLISMVWLPDHPRLVAALASLPFGVLVYATLNMVRTIFADFELSGTLERRTLNLVTTIVAVSGVSTWSQAITTTNEVTVAVFVILSMTLLFSAFRAGESGVLTLKRSIAIGALLGLAAGIKLTAAIYAPAGGLLLLAACRDWRQAIRCGIAFFLAWLCLFLLSWGPWAWHLYERTGDPFFPMFNNLFHSPYSAQSGGRDTRFMPGNALQWLFYPLYWLDDSVQTVYPFAFRDARFAAAYLLGIASLLHAWMARKRDPLNRNAPFIALAGFWILAYGTWLVIFSMLRYAIVLEISASVVALGAVMHFLRSKPGYRKAPLRLVTVVLFASSIIGFARIPDMGHVDFGNRTYSADVPELGHNPLIIFGNQPMGILAPLIVDTNPGATFVGLFSCFADNGWCHRGFYDYRLGRLMREKIASHRGSIYVAYYANRMPAMPQLTDFGVQFDSVYCSTMHTNRTPDVIICPANFDPQIIGSNAKPQHYRLALDTQAQIPDVHIHGSWINNPCTDVENPAQLDLKWHVPDDVPVVRIYIKAPPSSHMVLFAIAGSNGSVKTGKWVHAAQTFIFMDKKGNGIARSNIRYVPCETHVQ